MEILTKRARRAANALLAVSVAVAFASCSNDFEKKDGGDADTDSDTDSDTGTDTDTGTADCRPVGELPNGDCPSGNRRCCAGENTGRCFSILYCPFCCEAACVNRACE